MFLRLQIQPCVTSNKIGEQTKVHTSFTSQKDDNSILISMNLIISGFIYHSTQHQDLTYGVPLMGQRASTEVLHPDLS